MRLYIFRLRTIVILIEVVPDLHLKKKRYRAYYRDITICSYRESIELCQSDNICRNACVFDVFGVSLHRLAYVRGYTWRIISRLAFEYPDAQMLSLSRVPWPVRVCVLQSTLIKRTPIIWAAKKAYFSDKHIETKLGQKSQSVFILCRHFLAQYPFTNVENPTLQITCHCFGTFHSFGLPPNRHVWHVDALCVAAARAPSLLWCGITHVT